MFWRSRRFHWMMQAGVAIQKRLLDVNFVVFNFYMSRRRWHTSVITIVYYLIGFINNDIIGTSVQEFHSMLGKKVVKDVVSDGWTRHVSFFNWKFLRWRLRGRRFFKRPVKRRLVFNWWWSVSTWYRTWCFLWYVRMASCTNVTTDWFRCCEQSSNVLLWMQQTIIK